MKFTLAVTTLLGLVPAIHGQCSNPIQRKEWRALSVAERQAYTTAVDCLVTKLKSISQSDFPGAVHRFDDFIGVHKVQTPNIHFVGHFLPWHRYFVWAYEQTLRNECGYAGAQPYWDYTKDSASEATFRASPMWDTVSGFGSDGTGSQNCVTTGPFKNWVLNLPSGTSLQRQTRCLQRKLNPQQATTWLLKRYEDDVKSKNDYGWMSLALEGDTQGGSGLHGGGHFAVGGAAGDVYTSNSEPTFYLHHGNMDRIWTQWQGTNPQRLQDISNTITPRNNFLQPKPTPSGNVTLDFEVNLGPLGKPVKIRDIINTKSGLLCYEYV